MLTEGVAGGKSGNRVNPPKKRELPSDERDVLLSEYGKRNEAAIIVASERDALQRVLQRLILRAFIDHDPSMDEDVNRLIFVTNHFSKAYYDWFSSLAKPEHSFNLGSFFDTYSENPQMVLIAMAEGNFLRLPAADGAERTFNSFEAYMVALGARSNHPEAVKADSADATALVDRMVDETGAKVPKIDADNTSTLPS